MIGAGKYDAEATMVQESAKASAVLLIVIGGDRGAGFSCQATADVLVNLPAMLRSIADQLEGDIPQLGLTP